MATDATGVPTYPALLPRYNTAIDSPSGDGFNAAMDQVQVALNTKLEDPGGKVANEILAWNGSAWEAVSANLATHTATSAAGSWQPGVFTASSTDNQSLFMNSSTVSWTDYSYWEDRRFYEHSGAPVVVTGTTSATDWASITVPANSFGTNRVVRWTIVGQHAQGGTSQEVGYSLFLNGDEIIANSYGPNPWSVDYPAILTVTVAAVGSDVAMAWMVQDHSRDGTADVDLDEATSSVAIAQGYGMMWTESTFPCANAAENTFLVKAKPRASGNTHTMHYHYAELI